MCSVSAISVDWWCWGGGGGGGGVKMSVVLLDTNVGNADVPSNLLKPD